MQWGLFHEEASGEWPEQWHIAPELPDGRLHVRHSLHEFCSCGPRERRIGDHLVWIHQGDTPQALLRPSHEVSE